MIAQIKTLIPPFRRTLPGSVNQHYRRPGIRTRNLQSFPPSQTPGPPRGTVRTRLLSCTVFPRPSVIRMRAATSHLHSRMLSLTHTLGSFALPARGACAEPAARALTRWGCVLWLPLLPPLGASGTAKACSGIAGTGFLGLSLSLARDLPAPFTRQVAVENLPRPRCTPVTRSARCDPGTNQQLP